MTPVQADKFVRTFLYLFDTVSKGERSWINFWTNYSKHRPLFAKTDVKTLITQYSSDLSKCLTLLGESHPLTKKFLSTLPLRYSKTVFSWPPTAEMLEELMTD